MLITEFPLISQKHPHLRGEDSLPDDFLGWEWETPPPAWGRHVVKLRTIAKHRNTPTCVGKTILNEIRFCILEKHPHLRGEDTARSSASQRL